MASRKKEALMLSKICNELRLRGKIINIENVEILKHFGKRYHDAIGLVEKEYVKKYIFKPSGRVIWIVDGRKNKYQIFPEANFCSCDDYYFRVMRFEKDLCYHLVAQKIAESLNKFKKMEMPDVDYGVITEKFRSKKLN